MMSLLIASLMYILCLSVTHAFSDADLQLLESKCTIEKFDHACVTRAQYSDGTPNALNYNTASQPELPGTTIWINEWMAPGHMEYDLQFLQVLHVTKVDRIVLQRAPCFRNDFCEGITYWNSFFKGIYTAALLSANISIPVYFRYHPHEPYWQPHLLSEGDIIGDPLVYPNITVQNSVCFGRLIRRAYSNKCYGPCNGNLGLCFAQAISKEVATKFKLGAYKLIFPQNTPSVVLADYPKDRTRVITLAHRSGIKRGMADPQALFRDIQQHFVQNSNILVRLFNTRNSSITYDEQILLAATSDVVICTHGAFVGNLIYMRDGSLLLELSGDYDNTLNALPFEALANIFSVRRVTTKIASLKSQETINYVITDEETDAIISIIDQFLIN